MLQRVDRGLRGFGIRRAAHAADDLPVANVSAVDDDQRWNEDDTINYSHALPRRLPAEVLFDAIHQATGSPSRIAGLPVGLRAAQLPDAGISLPFLDDFGRPPRESACECERSSGVVLGPIMKLINGPTVNDALVDPQNELARLVAGSSDDRQLIEEVFLRFLARRPTEKELELGVISLQAAAGRRAIGPRAAGHVPPAVGRAAVGVGGRSAATGPLDRVERLEIAIGVRSRVAARFDGCRDGHRDPGQGYVRSRRLDVAGNC